MKKITACIITLFFSAPLFSQNLEYGLSEKFETIEKHEDLGLYQLNENQYVSTYFKKGEDIIFQVFNKDLKKINKQEIAPLPINSKDYKNEGFYSIKNNHYWFYSTWDKKTETERLFALPLNIQSLKFEPIEIKLLETGRLVPSMKYRIYYSTDSTKMLVTYRLKPKNRNDKLNKDIIGFNLFDSKMNKLYSNEIEMPYSEYEMNNLDYKIDSRGNIFMLAEVRINNSINGEVNKNNDSLNEYRFELIKVNQTNNTLQSIKINLQDKYTNSVILSEDLNHNIVIAGYYSNRKKKKDSDGAYLIRLEYDNNNNNSIQNVKTSYCEFPAEILKAYESKRAKRKMDKKEKDDDLEAANLEFEKLVFYSDGSVLIIGEEFFSITRTYTDRGTNITTTTSTYYYNDILALKVDKNGNTVWCKKIPKQQKSGIAEYSTLYNGLSFHHHNYNGEDYFFYLDNVKNIDLPLTSTPNEFIDGIDAYLSCVKIDKNGQMTKNAIFELNKERINIHPEKFESITNKLIIEKLRVDKSESKIFKLEIK